MSRLMKIGKFVLPRSRLACCFLRGNGCGRGPTQKMSFRKHSFAFGGATIRSTSELAGVDEDGSARAGRRANQSRPVLRSSPFHRIGSHSARQPPCPTGTLRTVLKGRCAVSVIRRMRRCNGAMLPLARHFAFAIQARRSSSFRFPVNDFPEHLQNKTMKTKSVVTIATIAFLPIAGFAQLSPPPAPPTPPTTPPGPPDRHEKMPKVPVTFLGV